MTRSVIVTGGAGYIGSHTCKALAAAGFTPVVYDNLSLGHSAFVQWGPLVVGDTRDAAAVEAAIRTHHAVAVVHFAALSSVGESMARPELYYDNNVGGLLGLTAGMRAAGCDAIVFSSTAATYGEPEVTPIVESAPTRPVNPYGRSKLMCEEILRDLGAAHGLKSIALRYFNAAGADPDGDVGELRDAETHLIPRAMMALQGWINDFQVFGSDFPTPDGTAIRDYIHVADLASAHVLAVQRLLDGGESGVFNLGTGTGFSVGEVLREVSRVTNRDLGDAKGPRRAGDPVQLVADPAAARAALGFSATRSSLPIIVETAWRWHQKAHPLRSLS